jgi:hypothetical protein
MSNVEAGVPRMPNPPDGYDKEYFEQVWRVFRQWAQQLVAPSKEEIGEGAVEQVDTTPIMVGLSSGAIFADTTNTAIIVTLPGPSTVRGRQFVVKLIIKPGANNVTVKSASGNIDGTAGATGVTISTLYAAKTFKSDGTDYWIIGSV